MTYPSNTMGIGADASELRGRLIGAMAGSSDDIVNEAQRQGGQYAQQLAEQKQREAVEAVRQRYGDQAAAAAQAGINAASQSGQFIGGDNSFVNVTGKTLVGGGITSIIASGGVLAPVALIAIGVGAGFVVLDNAWSDWDGSWGAEDDYPRFARQYAALTSGADGIESLLGVSGSLQNRTRVRWRVYELVAKTNPRILSYGWPYAGPHNNVPNTDEGSSFRSATGSAAEHRGIETRWEASAWQEAITLGYATGRAGRRLNVLRQCMLTLARIRAFLALIPTVQERRGIFLAILKKYVGANSLAGLEFLGAPTTIPVAFDQLMSLPYSGTIDITVDPNFVSAFKPSAVSKSVGSGPYLDRTGKKLNPNQLTASSPLLPLAAVGALIYFGSKA